MRKILTVIALPLFVLTGCNSLRFASSEAQKQNAWLHNRTAAAAAETAGEEAASRKLQALTRLSQAQSRAFVSYCGLPEQLPQADTAEDILSQVNWQLAQTALSESAERPDTWQVADSMFELAIGISALLGGVCGTRAMRFLREARAKSRALKEIVEGNEVFKKEHNLQADTFKQAHKGQSPQTRQLVAAMKPV